MKFLILSEKRVTFCLILLCLTTNLFAKELLTEIRVTDGDTVKGKYANELIKIRLAEIDAPELKQAFGIESKGCLKELIKHYEKKIKPIMPVNADFLMKKYKIPEGKQLGDKLRVIEDKWVKNNFEISDEDVDNIVNS